VIKNGELPFASSLPYSLPSPSCTCKHKNTVKILLNYSFNISSFIKINFSKQKLDQVVLIESAGVKLKLSISAALNKNPNILAITTIKNHDYS
jgi:hypothetical protein